ncbi:OLC1v1005647C1 [Oldenlandia corymbosa var. corymbosa]|uniref:OLC1v1005647C1 n=1 Tax=Oldenlandia corymbosa var. corymbosa TaxID=529605 RepID=A0AAV1DF47_OLDCO|nr:OLC1v1005647C1 [Oldenlandia corymbosa var. corymbosa]
MADSSRGSASFWTQADALHRKNLAFQVYQAWWCPVASPTLWHLLLQILEPEYRAVQSEFTPFTDLPVESCRKTGSCPATILLAGQNVTFGQSLGENMIPSSPPLNISDIFYSATSVLGSASKPFPTNLIEPAFVSDQSVYFLHKYCALNSSSFVPLRFGSATFNQEIHCIRGLNLWRNSSTEINDELYKGYRKANAKQKVNEIIAAYDFLNTDATIFNVSIWYNSTYRNDSGNNPISATRVPRSVNLASNAYLQLLFGPGPKILFEFVKDMPRPESRLRLDLSSLLGPMFFTWVVLQLFPVMLTSLVYGREQRLRIMMKMHGLGDGPYWMISYSYFLLLSSLYMIVFVIFGSLIGLRFFTLNDYSLQLVLYFFHINLQILLAFLVSVLFSNVKTASVVGYIIVLGTGLLGTFLFQPFLQDSSFPRGWITAMELFPGFSLYRGLYDLAQYSFTGYYLGTVGMQWKNLSERNNELKEVLIVIVVEWPVVLLLAFYLDQVVSSRRSPTFFMQNIRKKPLSSFRKSSFEGQGSVDIAQMDKPDVHQEVYPGRDGNPEKIAVKGLSLALPRGECFGMLGPNGAGKTSFKKHGREHPPFYGRLKNLKGVVLTQAVEESLKSVNLFYGSIADKQAGKYSGGMKRRLSVAISLIGDPKVVYMDEPSTGLDPASRSNLWKVVKQAKQDRAIILTTHSMEEAEHLCDRLGIFADGDLQCIGNPKELRATYGGSYIFTMTTSATHEVEVENLVREFSRSAIRTYQISGTQKFELSKNEVKIADVFHAVEEAKSRFTVHAWGLADTTLEDVFIKVARGAQAFDVLS